ncbi:hypothetical protein Q9233_008117, partial [Columba guinea]
MANRTNSSEYFWSYEYYWDYIDPIPVDGSKLKVNKLTELLCCVHRFYCHSLLGWACCVCDISFPYFTVYVPLWINSSKVSTTRDK